MGSVRKLFCKQCCRDDIHKPIRYPILLEGMFILISLGLIVLFGPNIAFRAEESAFLNFGNAGTTKF